MVDVPIVILDRFLATGRDDEAAAAVRHALCNLGVLILRDPRIPEGLPVRYRDMMEDFYRLPTETKAALIMPKLPDGRQIYETGWRPPNTEASRKRVEVIPLIPEHMRPHDPPETDPKQRYMWPFGPRPEKSLFPMLDYLAHYNPDIPEWVPTKAAWAKVMYEAMMTVMELLALGFDEPRELLADVMREGPHRLAPTGLDLELHGDPGTVAAGFHNDLSALTIHGKANFPGLWAWTRDWVRFPVRLPDDGCLLVQAGRVLEHFTAGATLRGYHEVVMGPDSKRQRRHRVSTTAFFNGRTDQHIKPLGKFALRPGAEVHDLNMLVGDRMMETLVRKVRVAA